MEETSFQVPWFSVSTGSFFQEVLFIMLSSGFKRSLFTHNKFVSLHQEVNQETNTIKRVLQFNFECFFSLHQSPVSPISSKKAFFRKFLSFLNFMFPKNIRLLLFQRGRNQISQVLDACSMEGLSLAIPCTKLSSILNFQNVLLFIFAPFSYVDF